MSDKCTTDGVNSYAITELKEDVKTLRQDVDAIKQSLAGWHPLIKRLEEPPYLQCPMHELKMGEFDKRLLAVEADTKSISQKVITWTAIASVILFLLSQVGIPYAIGNFKVVHSDQPRTESTNGFGQFGLR